MGIFMCAAKEILVTVHEKAMIRYTTIMYFIILHFIIMYFIISKVGSLIVFADTINCVSGRLN